MVAFVASITEPAEPPVERIRDVPVSPVPIVTGTSLASDGRERRVVLRISTPLGVAMHFLSADHAASLGAELSRLAVAARAGGLVVANQIPKLGS